MSKQTPEYTAWINMKMRCRTSYSESCYYSDRDIDICDRWTKSFDSFLKDMGMRPTSEHSLDRINNNKGYSANNCRWATKIEQATNRRSTLFFEHNGKINTLAGWGRELGINVKTLESRKKRGSLAFNQIYKTFLMAKAAQENDEGLAS